MEILTLDRLPAETQRAVRNGEPRTLCPVCRGGRTSELSLSIREVDGLLKLSCWRASCGFYAVSFIDPGARLHPKKLPEGRPYVYATEPIDGDLQAFLGIEYGLNPSVYTNQGWRMEQNTRNLVMPVRCSNGLIRGHVMRTFDDPKRVMAYKATVQPWLDWWAGDELLSVVVVEDQLSACRLNQLGHTACALLGTNMSADDAREIAHVAGTRKVILALDRDAFLKSLKLVKRHSHIVRLEPVCLGADIKNMPTDAEIKKLLGDIHVRRDTASSSDSAGSECL